jgi:hypothetical protein
VPRREAFEQVAAQAAELSAKLARTIVKPMRNVLEIMVLSSSLFFSRFRAGIQNAQPASRDIGAKSLEEQCSAYGF